jgi:coenzyme F420-0:L-glutamate ligase/coenzyme F420-1:gamma-L-glutamate ligase
MSRKEYEISPKEQKNDRYEVISISGIPEIGVGDNIGKIIVECSQEIGKLEGRDIVVVASKIVSKAEGRVVEISGIELSDKATRLSEATGKQAEVCQLILDESTDCTVHGRTIIARHKLGYMLTSAGIDRIDDSHVSLIPENPDLSAQKIRQEIERLSHVEIAVVIVDSEGREDRMGAGAITLGVSGIDPIRRTVSPLGKQQEETISDMVANAASILIGQRGKNTPVVIIRGLNLERNTQVGMQDYLQR